MKETKSVQLKLESHVEKSCVGRYWSQEGHQKWLLGLKRRMKVFSQMSRCYKKTSVEGILRQKTSVGILRQKISVGILRQKTWAGIELREFLGWVCLRSFEFVMMSRPLLLCLSCEKWCIYLWSWQQEWHFCVGVWFHSERDFRRDCKLSCLRSWEGKTRHSSRKTAFTRLESLSFWESLLFSLSHTSSSS